MTESVKTENINGTLAGVSGCRANGRYWLKPTKFFNFFGILRRSQVAKLYLEMRKSLNEGGPHDLHQE